MRLKWGREMAALPNIPWLESIDFVVQSDPLEIARQAAKVDISPIFLKDAEISDILSFLGSLTGKASVLGKLGIPESVPSGLSLD